LVDEPQAAVRQADELVAVAMKRLAEGFREQRNTRGAIRRKKLWVAPAKTPFDLVLMDIRLKRPMDGIAAADRLKQELQTPVV
jgi:CheY-like chemotaxis protein